MDHLSSHVDELHEVLLIELHHRFYNSLQVISSLAGGLIRENASGSTSRRTALELQNRIAVIARLHRLLAEPQSEDLNQSCETLCRTLASAYDRCDLALQLSLPAVPMSSGHCRGFMLMLAELITNALKHAPADRPLKLEIELTSTTRGYELAVRNSGAHVASGCATAPRVGSQLASRFGGVLTADAHDGYNVRVTMPTH